MEEIMYQEIDVKLNVRFSESQVRSQTAILDAEIKSNIQKRNESLREVNPMEVTSIESSMTNTHIRITTSVDARLGKQGIIAQIRYRVRDLLPWGVVDIEVLSLREEAEIYGNQ